MPSSVEAHVLHLARLTLDAGLDGAIASPQEIRPLRLALGRHAVILTPGIRPGGPAGDDQMRIATATDAIRAGADYIVVGRPVTQAPDAAAAAAALVEEINRA